MSDLATFLGPGKSKRPSPATLRPRHVMEVEEHFDDQSLDVFCFPISGRSNGEFQRWDILGQRAGRVIVASAQFLFKDQLFEITRDQKVYVYIIIIYIYIYIYSFTIIYNYVCVLKIIYIYRYIGISACVCVCVCHAFSSPAHLQADLACFGWLEGTRSPGDLQQEYDN